MPRHKLARKNTGIGVSFSPEDLDWLKSTYGKRHSITDLVRCALHEARCWRSGASYPLPPPIPEPPLMYCGIPLNPKPMLGAENWREAVRACDIPEDLEPHDLSPEDQRHDAIAGELPAGCVQTSLTDTP